MTEQRLINANELPVSSIDAVDVDKYIAKYGTGIPVVLLSDIEHAPIIEPEQKKAKLIPCSVRHPGENGNYLAQTNAGGFMVISYWNGLWNASEYGAEFAFEDGQIVAWMSLPEQWEGEQP